MEKNQLVKDNQIAVIKKFLGKNIFKLVNKYNWSEYNNTVVKITNIRKYSDGSNKYRTHKKYIYQFDVIVDMKCDYWAYSTQYQKNHARSANRYIRRLIDATIKEELKYFGISDIDEIVVKKITWDYL
jgi:hypothetical protein